MKSSRSSAATDLFPPVPSRSTLAYRAPPLAFCSPCWRAAPGATCSTRRYRVRRRPMGPILAALFELGCPSSPGGRARPSVSPSRAPAARRPCRAARRRLQPVRSGLMMAAPLMTAGLRIALTTDPVFASLPRSHRGSHGRVRRGRGSGGDGLIGGSTGGVFGGGSLRRRARCLDGVVLLRRCRHLWRPRAHRGARAGERTRRSGVRRCAGAHGAESSSPPTMSRCAPWRVAGRRCRYE